MTEHLEQGAVIVLDEIVRRAVRAHASDIHLEPKRDRMNVRFRVDGEMIEEQSVPLDISSEVVSRIKVLARMDIAERRVPQDGQLTLTPEGNTVHLRASSFPASLGEKIVMRILSGQALIPFEKIGLDAVTQAIVRELVDRPQGFLVTSGPTGAGKTSTLYSFMRLIDTRRTNVMTLEDPIEVELPQITQGQTNVKAGFTFATGLRAILRQDPDVIMVGEIRDTETAGIALQASLTGHLVLSTLHTSDAVESAVRLVDLGVEPWIVANALTGILAQRLVRLVCKNCQELVPLESDLVDGDEVILEKGTKVIKPKGCQTCLRTGYKGRTGIFEVVMVDDDMRELIKHKASPREYRLLLKKRGIATLRRIGLMKVKEGLTTVEEVVRVTI
ncbi:MAG: Type fimbrial assembly, ATPase PilB [Myxococcaceae bacterium]|jgi:general secretion pathway protein E|nr:Type fimbrial assembly, ATPase PilB [Myxococcaceae bacterium]MEA2751404.1 ral secretion pathway protein [Myxococcales bacterium]